MYKNSIYYFKLSFFIITIAIFKTKYTMKHLIYLFLVCLYANIGLAQKYFDIKFNIPKQKISIYKTKKDSIDLKKTKKMAFRPNKVDYFVDINKLPIFYDIGSYHYYKKKDTFFIKTPLFEFKYVLNNIFISQSITNTSYIYTDKVCPKPNPFIIEGKYVENMPEGCFLFYKSDNIGNKKTFYFLLILKMVCLMAKVFVL
jgi:hypothetical protein